MQPTAKAGSWTMLAIACASFLSVGVANAQDGPASKDGKPLEDKKFEVPFWDRSDAFQIRAAINLIGEGNVIHVLAARMAISESVPTVEGWEFDFDKALPLSTDYLAVIRDGRPLPDMRAREIIDLKLPDKGMYLAYLQALRRASSATAEMFQKSGADNPNVVYTHLAHEAALYRGKVITVKGKLRSIKEVEAPPLVQHNGILKIYTSWIIGPTKGAPPFAIVFTHLPKGLDVSEKLNADVTFHGYFLGNILVPADKEKGVTKKELSCPWLIGKTLIVTETKTEPAPTWSSDVIAYTVGGIVGVSILIALLNFYFRRADRRTQAELAELRDKHHPFSLEPPAGNEVVEPNAAEPIDPMKEN